MALACFFGAVSASTSTPTKRITSMKSLSTSHKLALLAAAQISPKSFSKGKLPIWSDLFSPDDQPWVDYMFVDIRTLLIQSIKVSEDVPLPELDWRYDIDIEGGGWKFNLTFTFTSEDTEMIGQKRTTSVNEITPTSFKNTFHAPNFIWRSPKAEFRLTDNDGDYYFSYSDYFVGLNNLTLVTKAEYEFVPEMGIQISNFSIDFDVGYLRTNLDKNILRYPNGTIEDLGAVKLDYTEYLYDDWKYYAGRYLEGLPFRINCVLVRKT